MQDSATTGGGRRAAGVFIKVTKARLPLVRTVPAPAILEKKEVFHRDRRRSGVDIENQVEYCSVLFRTSTRFVSQTLCPVGQSMTFTSCNSASDLLKTNTNFSSIP